MQSKDTIHPEELLSATFDGEHDSAVDVPAERRAKLEQEWETIRSGIQAAPSASIDLVSLVRSEIAETEQPTVVTRQSHTLRRNSLLFAIPGLISIAAVLLLAVLPRLQESEMAPQLGSIILPSVAASDWDVVVVNVSDDSNLQDSVRAVLGTAEQHGAGVRQLTTRNGDSAEYTAGILLANGRDPAPIVNSLEQSHQHLDWNPGEIDGRSPEEIKQLFLSSMEIPSQSEMVFGAMYIVHEDSLSVTPVPLESDADGNTDPIEIADNQVLDQPSRSSQLLKAQTSTSEEEIKAKPRTPLVVIFRRSASSSKPPVLPDQGSLPVKAGIKPTV